MVFILQIIILIYSVILHEISHGFVAELLGDPTARISKRLTLDPRPHIDPLMTIALPLILVLSGSPVIFGAAKPVPIDPFNFREPKKDTALTAVAGPLANIALAVLFGLILKISAIVSFANTDLNSLIGQIGFFAVQLNIFLAVFNLLPVPPLDGFKFVGGLLPDEYAGEWYSLERYGFLFLIIILFFFNPIINRVVLPVSSFLIRLILP
ncbi:MAG: site-2 protease family protein [Patescibacteria group bacterium]|nr:site-2 protease family protein [Patescibacteria group bacterium]